MKLGLYGGTFDPVHYGHLLLAERCREELGLDEVRFIPAGDPPHKDQAGISPGKARADMLDFATAGNPRFVVDRRELSRPGPSYTVDTLAEFRAEFPPVDRERRVPSHGEVEHLGPGLAGRQVSPVLVRRVAGDDEPDLVQPQLLAAPLGEQQVAVMDRVERAAVEAELHETSLKEPRPAGALPSVAAN